MADDADAEAESGQVRSKFGFGVGGGGDGDWPITPGRRPAAQAPDAAAPVSQVVHREEDQQVFIVQGIYSCCVCVCVLDSINVQFSNLFLLQRDLYTLSRHRAQLGEVVRSNIPSLSTPANRSTPAISSANFSQPPHFQWRIQDFCKGGAAAGAFGVPQAPSCPLSLRPLRKFRGS